MDLAPGDRVQAVLRMRKERTVRRRLMIPKHYINRQRCESTMYQQFIDKGGKPTRPHPHYLILGESDLWVEQESQSLRIPLSDIPTDVISFTYTDSWYAYIDQDLNGNPVPRKPQYEMLYRLEELDDLFEKYGWPGDRWREDPEYKFDYYVEAQVWSDEPLHQRMKDEG